MKQNTIEYSPKINYNKLVTWVIAVVILTAFALSSCSSDNDDKTESCIAPPDPIVVLEPETLASSIYLPMADEEQPAWIQELIASNPYIKVFHSEKGAGAYLVEMPLKGHEITVFDNNGSPLSESTEMQLQQTIQDGQPWTLTHIYSYPLKPGDAEWDFSRYTTADIKQMLQLPTEILNGMSTSDLIETSLDFYYSAEFIFSETFQQGVESVRQQFNGLDELLKRNDLATAILKQYELKLQTAEVMKTQESAIQGDYSIHLMLLKMLVAQDEVLNQLSREQLRQLITISIEAWNMVFTMPEMFGTVHLTPSLFLFSRIIVREGGFEYESEEERQKLAYFAQTCTEEPAVIAIFTPDMQQRIFSYLQSL